MVGDYVVGVKGANDLLSGLELLPVVILFLEHLLLILLALVGEMLESLLDRVVNVFGLLVHSPPAVNLGRLELVLVLVHQLVDLSVLLYLHPHFLYLCGHLSLQVVLQLTCLLDVLSHLLYLLLDLSKLLQLLLSRSDHSVCYNPDQPLSDRTVLVLKEI